MLVLSRKKGEGIILGDDIKVTVLDVDGDRISIGIDAPRDVTILREELLLETKDLNKQSINKKALKNIS